MSTQTTDAEMKADPSSAMDRGAIKSRLSPGAKQAAGKISRLGGVLAILGLGSFMSYYASKSVAPPPPPIPKTVAAPARTLDLPKDEPVRLMVMNPIGRAEGRPFQRVDAQARPAELTAEEQLMLASQRAPVFAYHKGRSSSHKALENGAEAGRETEDKGAFARSFTPSNFQAVRAGMVGDRRFLLLQGTDIPCILENAIQSDIPGFASCVITRDVLSANGQVVLMERGTKVFGEYRGGLTAGVSRLNVLWARAVTPAGVDVPLASAATDALGRAGVGGDVDTHFMERFGAAFLLSVVSDVSQIGADRLKRSQGVNANSAQSGNSAAAIAVEQTHQIKPTLNVRHGSEVSIKVTRDIDFSSVYRLRHIKNTGAWNAGPNLGEPLK